MLHNTDDDKQLRKILFGKPIHRIGLIICIAMFLLSSVVFVLFYENENKWLILFPISSVIIISLVFWYINNIKKQLNDIYYFTSISKENEKILHQLVYYDNLTGLPNRKMVLDEVERMIDKEYIDKFYLIYFDLDDFKRINETAGYCVGDEILRYVSDRWNNLKKDRDILGHLGGDEFSLLIKDDMDHDSLMEYIEGFRMVLNEPISLMGKAYYVSASFGIAEYPNDGRDVTTLLRSSYIAMNTAKDTGKNYVQFYTYEMQLEILKRLQIENGLLYSIKNNEIYMVYQPMYHCDTKMLYGFEALARWKYPGMGSISPAQFIPIAEETGMIIDLGKWIIKEVLTKFMKFQRKYQIKTVVSINISVVQMIEPSFVPMIEDVLDETGFDGKYLELEITESVLISYPEHIIEIITQLRTLGIRIALDDFGTGYASINYLQMLPINILKIGKTFIDKIDKDDTMNQIIKYIINLAHQLDIEVVAEGVEHQEQIDFLRLTGCDYIQGFLLSKPLNEEHVSQHLLSYHEC
ncbi:MAG: bifunctional diguanylate cyclase/phosphodiesterase [Anaerolineaceae bacterium]|nr:MAG: bifunctional diguanylate cyclase/phosphodiesterase [Anaerolineaceae bacterium]